VIDRPHDDAKWPRPLGKVALHGLAGDIVREIGPHSEADPVAVLVQLFVGFGNIIGRHAHFQAEADQHYGNLFVCLVGRTAKGRKGASWGQVHRILRGVDPAWHVDGGLSSGEGLIWAVRDEVIDQEPIREGKSRYGPVKEYQNVVKDPGIDDKRLLVQESEFVSVLKVAARDRNTISSVIRQAWDTGNLATLTKNSPTRATNAHISIVGHITRDELRKCMTDVDLANGLANRFLWVCVERSKILPEGGNLSQGRITAMQGDVAEAVKRAEKVYLMVRTGAAKELWASVYGDLSEGRPGLLGAATSRGESQTMRLAMLYALLDQSEAIDDVHLEAALELWRYCMESAEFIFGGALGDPIADRLLRQLRRKGASGMPMKEIHGLFGGNKSGDDLRRAISMLEDHGLANIEKKVTKGRPSEIVFATK